MAGKILVTPGVESHLRKIIQNLGITDFTLDVTPGSKRGDNFFGVIARVHVKGKSKKQGTDTTLDFVTKTAPDISVYRDFYPLIPTYNREIYMYMKVLPEYVKLQNQKGVSNRFSSFAKIYSSSMETKNEVIVMENMKEKGYKMWNRMVPVDYNHLVLMLKNLGKFHALSIAIKDQNPKLFEELAANTQEEVNVEGKVTKERIQSIERYFDLALEAFDPVTNKDAYDKFKTFLSHRMKKYYEVQKSESAGNYAVIGHGDCWINNFLFKYGDSERPSVPTDICFLDWQLSRLGSPVLDLAYFIFTSTDQQFRDTHYKTLIDEYYASFSSFLNELGSDPKKLFPYHVLQKHLKQFSVYGLFMSVILLYFISSEDNEIPDVTTISSLEDAINKFSYITKNIDKYRARIRGVVLDFIKYGYDF